MAAGRLIFPGLMPAEDANGVRISGARAYVYENGTTTPATFYTLADLVTPIGPYVEADSNGVWPQMWADTANLFNLSLTDSDGVPLPNGAWSAVGPLIDATLASVALAETAQEAAETAQTAAAASATAAAASAVAAQAVADDFIGLEASVAAAAASAEAAAASAAEAAMFDPTTYALKATTITGAGLATGGGSIAANRVITVTGATDAQVLAQAANDVAMTPANMPGIVGLMVALSSALS